MCSNMMEEIARRWTFYYYPSQIAIKMVRFRMKLVRHLEQIER